MSALYERTQGTVVRISSLPAANYEGVTFLNLQCSVKEVQFTAGQKNDIDVTTLCSLEQENINGLPSPAEISISGNFYRNSAQDSLRSAYDTDHLYAFQIIFPSGHGFQFIAEVRQHTWSVATGGVVAATFSLRLKGKPSYLEKIPATAISVTPASSTVRVGQTTQFKVAVSPDDATVKDFMAFSRDTDIAQITQKGDQVEVRGNKPGEVMIDVMSEDGDHSAAHKVTVTAA